MYMMYNPKQKFYYLGGQRDDEVLIFKNFDSREDVCPCRCCVMVPIRYQADCALGQMHRMPHSGTPCIAQMGSYEKALK
jgi:hypothetical protein